jgi:hypothetical protein
MPFTARLLTLLAVIFLSSGCGHKFTPLPPEPWRLKKAEPVPEAPLPPDALHASPRRLVGRIVAVDAARGFAFVDLTDEPPAGALVDGAELIVRTDDLRETARLKASRHARGRTLGTQIVQGQPTPGDEVVFQAP